MKARPSFRAKVSVTVSRLPVDRKAVAKGICYPHFFDDGIDCISLDGSEDSSKKGTVSLHITAVCTARVPIDTAAKGS